MRTTRLAGIIAVWFTSPAAAALAQPLAPMTTVRVVNSAGIAQGRLEGADSTTLRILVGNDHRLYQRADVTLFQREHNGGTGMKVGAITGAALGGLMLGSMVVGMCESPTGCNGDIPLAAAIGALGGGLAGATILGVLGTMVPRWIPVRNPWIASSTAFSPFSHVRGEMQLGAANATGTLGRGGHLSLAGFRGRSAVGAEMGLVRRTRRITGTQFQASFYGGFAELPLGEGFFHPALVGSLDLYRAKQQSIGSQSTVSLGGGSIGLKTAAHLGENFAIGLSARIHQIGFDNHALESGITFAFRP